MRALLHCGERPRWTEALGEVAWPLLPMGNRPLLEYWFEVALRLGIQDVRILLGHRAEDIEAYAGDGARWGLRITYGFVKDDTRPEHFFRRSPEAWRDGLLFLGQPCFPLRTTGDVGEANGDQAPLICLQHDQERMSCLFATGTPASIEAFCQNGTWPDEREHSFSTLGFHPLHMADLKTYYNLNMRLVAGEITRYLQPGYYAADGSHVGYNVVLPPSVRTKPPLMIGNDCRFAPLASLGPNAVLGSHIVADRGSSLANCIVLDGTYIGQNIEIASKIASGNRIVDPESGAFAQLDDPWLMASLGPVARLGDIARALVEWPLALLWLLILLLPFCLLYPLARKRGGRFDLQKVQGNFGRQIKFPRWQTNGGKGIPSGLFHRLGLDLLPRLWLVLLGRLWLCGQPPLSPDAGELLRELPHYHPGCVSYSDLRREDHLPGIRDIEARYYAHHHSLAEDMRLLARFALYRLFSATPPPPHQCSDSPATQT